MLAHIYVYLNATIAFLMDLLCKLGAIFVLDYFRKKGKIFVVVVVVVLFLFSLFSLLSI